MGTDEPTLHRVVMTLCSACLDGEGDQCHTPGCAFIRSRCPDLPLRDRPDIESIDGVPFDYDTLKRAADPATWTADRQRGLVERVARVISEYPDGQDWWKANAKQRERWEDLAKRALAMVCTEAIPQCIAAERAAVVDFLRAIQPAPRRSAPADYALRAVRDVADHIEAGAHTRSAETTPPCYDCASTTAERSACPLCSKVVCRDCAEKPYTFCCDAADELSQAAAPGGQTGGHVPAGRYGNPEE